MQVTFHHCSNNVIVCCGLQILFVPSYAPAFAYGSTFLIGTLLEGCVIAQAVSRQLLIVEKPFVKTVMDIYVLQNQKISCLPEKLSTV
jgi:hypothetical protein